MGLRVTCEASILDVDCSAWLLALNSVNVNYDFKN